MATGTSAVNPACRQAEPPSSITARVRALRGRLHIWRIRHWIRDRPEAIQAVAGDTYRHLHFAATGSRHIHFVREAGLRDNWCFFEWLQEHDPAAARLFRHTTTGGPLARPTSGTSLLIPWLWDPVRERKPALYRRLQALEARYERAGVPIINPVRHLSNAIKSRALATLRHAGFTAARALPLSGHSTFDEITAAVGLPFIVRNDHGSHGYVQLVHTPGDFQQVDWSRLPHPVALEYIDTRSADGLFRKYRYLVTGDSGINRHLIIARPWCVHAGDRVRERAYVDEEVAFLNEPNPHREALVRAARALKLDFVAFDYSVTRSGKLVIWEPNPFPGLWSNANHTDRYFDYQRAWIDKVFRHVLRFYLRRANLDAAT
ncbi:MAG TPA: hypothetical protein VFM97_11975 [Gammaproteobacteria bacterium]|nr:hypothetical protein [Gammaproteobacteria bacterium]